MIVRTHPYLIISLLVSLFFSLSISAQSSSKVLVLLRETERPVQYKILGQDPPSLRYKKTMNYQNYLKSQVLLKFVNESKARLNLANSNVELLPVVNGVSMNLSSMEQRALKNDPRVYKIIPNTPVYLDKPIYLGPISWGGRDDRQRPNSNLNAGLLLHKVDQLIKDGVDINKPGKIVGVVDTGVDGNHPALNNKVVAFKNIATGSTTPTDSDTHGTHVCGIIAGASIDGLQIGVYPGAKLVVASALSGIDNMVKGLQWIMDPDGDPNTADHPFVVNNSWHIGSADPEPFYRVIESFKNADILLAFSAGNAGQSGVTKPKEHPFTFTSAAVNAEGLIADFSSWGPAMYGGKEQQKPEVATMGVQVYSSLPGGKYGKMSGTSMASPFTAGSVALLGSQFPDKSPYLIAEILRQSTVEQQTSRPWHRQMGFGLLDVYSAYLKLKTLRAKVLNDSAMIHRQSNSGFQNRREF